MDSSFVRDQGQVVTFDTDRRSWDRLDELVVREGKARKKEEIWVSMIGKFEAIGVRSDGTMTGGFGHLGAFPAQIVVQRITNIVVNPKPTYDYNELLRGRPAHFHSIRPKGAATLPIRTRE